MTVRSIAATWGDMYLDYASLLVPQIHCVMWHHADRPDAATSSCLVGDRFWQLSLQGKLINVQKLLSCTQVT